MQRIAGGRGVLNPSSQQIYHPYLTKKILVVLWVMVRVVMRFPSSALIHNKGRSFGSCISSRITTVIQVGLYDLRNHN